MRFSSELEKFRFIPVYCVHLPRLSSFTALSHAETLSRPMSDFFKRHREPPVFFFLSVLKLQPIKPQHLHRWISLAVLNPNEKREVSHRRLFFPPIPRMRFISPSAAERTDGKVTRFPRCLFYRII